LPERASLGEAADSAIAAGLAIRGAQDRRDQAIVGCHGERDVGIGVAHDCHRPVAH
jgi:hypothetical protein